jgi:hypothetical protein
MTTTPTRVVWTLQEKQSISDELVKIFAVFPHMTSKEALRRAQMVLPNDRRIKVNDQRAFSHKARIQQARDQAAAFRVEPVEHADVKVDAATLPEEPRKIDGIGDLFELLVDAITDRVMERVRKEIEDQQQQKELQYTSSRTHSIPDIQGGILDALNGLSIRKPAVQSRPLLPTVTIVGLNGCQIDAIKTSHPRAIYTFLTAEQAKGRSVQANDHVILMTKFINHSAADKYRKAGPVHFCNGGISELRTLLNGLIGVAA